MMMMMMMMMMTAAQMGIETDAIATQVQTLITRAAVRQAVH
jgi:hypothetical protein